MAEFLSHVPGTFSWPELATTDQKAAVAFYRALFGWDVNESQINPTETYSIFQMRGKETAAAYTMQEDERKMGVPPHWNSYVTVTNTDEATKKAEELGAKVIVPPFDVMEHGRMAVLQDPTGAFFQVWQAKQHIGAKILEEPGALCWTELNTRDTKAAEAFYTQAVRMDARSTALHRRPMEYTEFSVQGKPSIGMMPMNEHMPPHVPWYWMPYFQVADADKSVDEGQGARRQGHGAADRHPEYGPLRDRQRSAGRDVRRLQVRRGPRDDVSTDGGRGLPDPEARPAVVERWRMTMFSKKPLTIPSKADALPGRAERMPVPDAHFVNSNRLTATVSRRDAAGALRHGLLLGRREEVLVGARRLLDRGRLCRRLDAERRPTAKSAPA